MPEHDVPRGVEHPGHDDLPLPAVRNRPGLGRSLRERGRKPFEGLGPALFRAFLVRPRGEPVMAERQLRLPSKFLEGYGQEHFQWRLGAEPVRGRGNNTALRVREAVCGH